MNLIQRRGKVRVVEQHVVGDGFKLGLLLGWGGITVLVYCSLHLQLVPK